MRQEEARDPPRGLHFCPAPGISFVSHFTRGVRHASDVSVVPRAARQRPLELVQSTRRGVGKIPPAERRDSVTILDIFGNAAIARVDPTTWVDFLELIKWNGQWVIVNVVWENRPRSH